MSNPNGIEAKAREYARFVDDLKMAADLLRENRRARRNAWRRAPDAAQRVALRC